MGEERKTVGLIGVGLLGSAIAERLVAAGFGVWAFDRDAARMRAVTEAEAQPAESCAAVGAAADRIVLSLPDSDVVADVLESEAGLAAHARENTVIIDTTTGAPQATIDLACRLEKRGIAYLDATVAGSSAQLRRREVTLLVGGDRAVFEACGDIFEALADRVFHTGLAGSGARTKLLVNQVLGLNRLALAESLALARALGLDEEALLAILKTTPAYSRVMDTKGAKMIAGDFAPHARLAQHRKDVGLILDLAKSVGMNLPVSALHARLLDEAIEHGFGELDNAAILRVLEKGSSSG